MTSRSETLPFSPVKFGPIYEEVLYQIVDAIRTQQFRLGDVLPAERVLATMMNVSRPTVRQALKALVDAGILDIAQKPIGGARVKSLWVPENLVRAESELRADEIFSLLEARRALEPRVAQLASFRGGDLEFDKMRDSIDLMRANLSNRERFWQSDLIFHRWMWKAAHNAVLEDLMKKLFRQLEFASELMVRIDAAQAVGVHQRTIDAILLGSRETEIAMDEHLSFLEAVCEETYGRTRVRPAPDFL